MSMEGGSTKRPNGASKEVDKYLAVLTVGTGFYTKELLRMYEEGKVSDDDIVAAGRIVEFAIENLSKIFIKYYDSEPLSDILE